MLSAGYGFFQLLYLVGALLFSVDIYHFFRNRGEEGLRAFINTAVITIVLIAIVELPFGLIIAIPYAAYVVGGVALLLIARGVYKILRWNNSRSSSNTSTK